MFPVDSDGLPIEPLYSEYLEKKRQESIDYLKRYNYGVFHKKR